MSKVNYKDFLDKYERSGMTHKEFGIQEGISSHMVGYYLKKARDERKMNIGFARVEVKQSPSGMIRISCPNGVILDIPV